MAAFIKQEKGQIIPFYILMTAIIAYFMLVVVDVGENMLTRMRMQNAADATALSFSVMKSRIANTLISYNAIAANRVNNRRMWQEPFTPMADSISVFFDLFGSNPGKAIPKLNKLFTGGGMVHEALPRRINSHYVSPYEGSLLFLVTYIQDVLTKPGVFWIPIQPKRNSIGAVMNAAYVYALSYSTLLFQYAYGAAATKMAMFTIPRLNGMDYALPVGALIGTVNDPLKVLTLAGDVGLEASFNTVRIAKTINTYIGGFPIIFGVPIPFLIPTGIWPDLASTPVECPNVPTHYTLRDNRTGYFAEHNRMDWLLFSKDIKNRQTRDLFHVNDKRYYTMSSSTIYTENPNVRNFIPTRGNKPAPRTDGFNYLLGTAPVENLNMIKPALTITTLDIFLTESVMSLFN